MHHTWALVGQQPRVDTYGLRKTAHLYATIELNEADFTYWFSPVFNGETFWVFLKRLVTKYAPRKVFLIIDNAPWHNLPPEGKEWLAANSKQIELCRLPGYSPELNPMEPVWKTTRKMTTHNRFYETTLERDIALRTSSTKFQRRPSLIAAHVARFQ